MEGIGRAQVLEFIEVLGPLTDARSHGGDPRGRTRAGHRGAPEHGQGPARHLRRPPTEQAAQDAADEHARSGRGYFAIQMTRPQTLGYGLTDSPAGQATWIAEKYRAWTDHDGDHETAVSRQTILDEISVYWFTASATSSARLYWESFAEPRVPITVLSGLSVYPRDIVRPSRREAEQRFTDLRRYAEMSRGGHFAALEQPASLVEQIRGFFRLVR